MADDDASTAPELAEALEGFVRHLTFERGRSAHTVRAYAGDVAGLLRFATAQQCMTPADIDLSLLRSWLGEQYDLGQARSTIARRAASVRAFTSWCERRGLIASDPGIRLKSPQVPLRLPTVLDVAQAERVMDIADQQAGDGDPVAVRDRAILEVLYGTGVRVSELCSLDVVDIQWESRTLLVLGKGRKERIVPFGIPAQSALTTWLDARPMLATAKSAEALFLGVRGKRLDPRAARSVVGRLTEAADVPRLAPHGLRHSAAT
ncbi:MAG: tyrosine-type recombinase/integrase, partial [Candidatus Nanopelagicales bacterium]